MGVLESLCFFKMRAYVKDSTIQNRVKKSEQSIEKLKAHMERGMCPKDLHYDTKANIAPEEVERKYIGALVKYH